MLEGNEFSVATPLRKRLTNKILTFNKNILFFLVHILNDVTILKIFASLCINYFFQITGKATSRAKIALEQFQPG